MMVVNDIGLVSCLKILNMLGNGELHFSDIFMTKQYLTVVERQSIRELSEEGKIVLFDSGNDFYDFYALNSNTFPIGLTEMSSIFYAKETNLPLITKCGLTKKMAEKNGILVYNYDEALKVLNTQEAHIEFINKILKTLENDQQEV